MYIKAGEIESQHREVKSRRPLTPILSFGQLSPIKVSDDGSMHSPLYLSPPVSGNASSPPPRKGDGYFGSFGDQHKKRKLRVNETRNRSPPLESSNIELHGSSMVESVTTGTNEVDIDDINEATMVRATQKAIQRPRTIGFNLHPEISRKVEQHSSEAAEKDKANNHESSAVRSLRRHSEANPPVSSLGPVLQSFSSKINTLFKFQDLGLLDSSSDEDVDQTTANTKRKKVTRRIGHVAGIQHGPKTKQRMDPTASVNTPATITLRKASESHYTKPRTSTNEETVAAEIVHQNGSAFQAAAAAMAFRSRPFDSRWLSSFEEYKDRMVSFPTKSDNQPGAARQRAMSVARFSESSGVERHSLVAENTLTLEEAHLNPGQFTTKLSPRRQSVSAVDTLRRLSVIRAGLHGSVHEIIWREDETSSSVSSVTSVSPVRKDSLSNSTLEQKHNRGKLAGTDLNSLPWVFNRKDTFSPVRKQSNPRSAIFDWSWNKQSPGLSNSRSTGPLLSGPRERTGEPQQRRPSISRSSRIQSFPPLNPRKHTSEWHQAPLPDLNDPTGGRPPHEIPHQEHPDGVGSLMDRGLEMYSSIPDAVSASVAPEICTDSVVRSTNRQFSQTHTGYASTLYDGTWGPGSRRSKSVSSAPFAPPRVADGSKIGSAIGVSSHQRVRR